MRSDEDSEDEDGKIMFCSVQMRAYIDSSLSSTAIKILRPCSSSAMSMHYTQRERERERERREAGKLLGEIQELSCLLLIESNGMRRASDCIYVYREGRGGGLDQHERRLFLFLFLRGFLARPLFFVFFLFLNRRNGCVGEGECECV